MARRSAYFTGKIMTQTASPNKTDKPDKALWLSTDSQDFYNKGYSTLVASYLKYSLKCRKPDTVTYVTA